jgi:hypothetical protein
MRLLTHNTLKNNTAEAKGKGFPLRITASEVKVQESSGNNEGVLMMDDERQVAFVKGVLSMLDWPALVQVRFVYTRLGWNSQEQKKERDVGYCW